jgi:myo-inositol-1(or 4)-monophosphatase
MNDLDHRLKAATQVALSAGRLAKDYFDRRHELAVELKGKQDLVSIADRSVEELIRRELGGAFPGDAFLGEEGGGIEADRLWVIDPIDGTMNFLRGMPYWCCVIAYVVEGVTELGLTMDPVHAELYVARRGHGATRNGQPIRVSDRSDAGEACVGLSFNFKQPGERYVSLIRGLIAAGFDHRRMGSSALALCHVADGRLDAATIPWCSSWDVIAGLLTVEEAGGLATGWTDGCSLTDNRAVAAAAPGVAEALGRASGIDLPRR